MLSKREFKTYKFFLPITFRRNNANVVITDGSFFHEIEFKNFERIIFKSIDSDGFISFEIYRSEPELLLEPSKVELKSNGYSIFSTSIAKALGHGWEKSIYEYYKRERDLSYYTLIKRNAIKSTKIYLGSLKDPTSAIGQAVQIISREISNSNFFDRQKLRSILPKPLHHGQKLKSILDILTAEGFLEKTETKRRGKPYERYVKTKKLSEILATSRLA